MKIVLIVAGVVFLPIAAVVVVGALLPKRHVVSRSAVFHASRERLFELIAGSQELRPEVKTCELISEPGGREFQKETSKRGETVLYELQSIHLPQSIVRRIATENLPYGGSWSFTLQPSGRETVVRITEDGEVYNPIFRFVSKFVIGHTATIDTYLQSMAAAVGEQIAIQD